MSDFRIDQITNQAGTAGPQIAGITTFSGTSGLIPPQGNAPVDNVLTGNLPTDFSSWSGISASRAAVVTDAAIAPDGTQTADEISNADTSNGVHNIFIYYSNFDTQASYIGEVFFKRVSSTTTQYVTMYVDGPTNNPSYIIFNLQTGKVEVDSSLFSSTTQYQMDDVGNGWYRCAVLIKTVSAAYRPFSFWPTPINVKIVDVSFTGDPTTGKIYAWSPSLYRVESNLPISEVISNIDLRRGNITPGAIRFNTDSMKLEYYRGGPVEFGTTTQTGEWVNLTTDSPDIQTGGARGVTGGGDNPANSIIDYINISTTGNAISFGTLAIPGLGPVGCASRTRGIFANAYPNTNGSDIQYITFASTGNSIDSGFDTTVARHESGGVSNSTRGIFAGGESGPGGDTTIDYITIDSLGNAQDFGDLVEAIRNVTGVNSSTRGIFLGGRNNTPASSSQKNTIQYVTISTLGNTSDFGDLTQTSGRCASVCNAVRGIRIGGETPAATNTIDYITMSTLGNAIDFGDATSVVSQVPGGMSSSTRGVYNVGSVVNTLEYIQIMSTGNAVDFGDSTYATARKYSISNGHGGLG
jgi:hypothetical protein